ncbi:hypothetical protein BBJ28_00026811, partial [Nothophytophthora sp. Chile5]
ATARTQVAQAFIGINAIVILVWFVRQLIVFSTYIRAWMVRSNSDSRGSDSLAKYETRTAADSEVYASISTARGANESVNGGTLVLPHGQQSQRSVESLESSYGQQAADSTYSFQQQQQHKHEIGF